MCEKYMKGKCGNCGITQCGCEAGGIVINNDHDGAKETWCKSCYDSIE